MHLSRQKKNDPFLAENEHSAGVPQLTEKNDAFQQAEKETDCLLAKNDPDMAGNNSQEAVQQSEMVEPPVLQLGEVAPEVVSHLEEPHPEMNEIDPQGIAPQLEENKAEDGPLVV